MSRKEQLQKMEQQLNTILLSTFKLRKTIDKELGVLKWMKSYMGFPTSINVMFLAIENRFNLYRTNRAIKKMIKQRNNIRFSMLFA